MSNSNSSPAAPATDVDPYVAWLIRHKVRRIVGTCGFTHGDADDLRQELAMHVVAGLRRHDPARASARTFADRIIGSKVASIVKHASAQKRDRRRVQPLGEAQRCAPGATWERLDLVLDVRDAVGRLPAETRSVALLFMEHRESEVVRRSGLSRQTVRGLRRRIGTELRAAGMTEDYVPRRQPTRRRTAYVSGDGGVVPPFRQTRAGRAAKASVGKSPKGDAPCA